MGRMTGMQGQGARIGVIGCGDWGRNHIRTLAGLGALVAVADADAARRNEVAATYGVRALSPEDMLGDVGVDGIVLALPPNRNADMAVRVLDAGKHLLVEKPMSLDLAGADAIVAAAARAGRVAMTGHLLRFHPGFEALEARVKAGDLGRLRYIHSVRAGLGKFFVQTDALWDIAPHDLSLILALSGEAPDRVHLEGVAMMSDAPDFAHLHLGFPSGLRSHTFISRLSPRRDRKLTVIGEGGMAVFDELEAPDRKLALYSHRILTNEGQVRVESVDPIYVPLPDTMPLAAELAHFIACIVSGATPRASVAEGSAVLRVLDAAEATEPAARREPTLA